jgi:hypothetical protein
MTERPGEFEKYICRFRENFSKRLYHATLPKTVGPIQRTITNYQLARKSIPATPILEHREAAESNQRPKVLVMVRGVIRLEFNILIIWRLGYDIKTNDVPRILGHNPLRFARF